MTQHSSSCVQSPCSKESQHRHRFSADVFSFLWKFYSEAAQQCHGLDVNILLHNIGTNKNSLHTLKTWAVFRTRFCFLKSLNALYITQFTAKIIWIKNEFLSVFVLFKKLPLTVFSFGEAGERCLQCKIFFLADVTPLSFCMPLKVYA